MSIRDRAVTDRMERDVHIRSRTKPALYLAKVCGPWWKNGSLVEYVWKPMCYAHRRWPCRDCGTAHYDGCKCGFCTSAPQTGNP